jgi:hypothetical protein
LTDSDSDPTRERASRELSPAPPSAQAREFVLPANAPQTRASERLSEPDWRTLFAGPSSRATLARISDGDPLGLEVRCRERIAARALLVDLERCVLRAALQGLAAVRVLAAPARRRRARTRARR